MSVIREAKTQYEIELLKQLKSSWKRDVKAKFGSAWRKRTNITVATWCC